MFRTNSSIPTVGFNMKRVTKGHVTLKWYVVLLRFSVVDIFYLAFGGVAWIIAVESLSVWSY